MSIRRREFLSSTAAAAAIAGPPARADAAAGAGARSYPYLGRADGHTDFKVIEPGLTITRIESWPAR